MKVNKVAARISSASCNPQELRRVARALGSELPHRRVDTLRQFRASMSRLPVSATARGADLDETSYAAGYVHSMLDISAEYESSIDQQQEAALSEHVGLGIRLAVSLFQHMVNSPYQNDAAMQDVATEVLGDALVAAQAVALWAAESRTAGLVTEPGIGTPVAALPEAEPAHSARPSMLRAMTTSIDELGEDEALPA